MDKIIVFGRGVYLKEKYQYLRKRYQIVGFLDNAVLGIEYDENYKVDVYNPNKINELDYDYIMCASIHFVEMWKQLQQFGVSGEKIKFIIEERPLNSDYIESAAFSHGEHLKIEGDKIYYCTNDNICYCIDDLDTFRCVVRQQYNSYYKDIAAITNLGFLPVNRRFGIERGKAVDRYYIEHFLELYKEDIKGEVMEIDSNLYTRKYGGDKVKKEIKLHVFGWNGAIKGNFETGEGLSEAMVDCLICTQTLQYIYDLESAMKNIYKILKPGGVALITVPGIKCLSENDDNNWGEKWSFTEKSVSILSEKFFGKDNYIVNTYGNVKIVTAYLYGICCEELKIDDFLYNDKQFPFLITARLIKNNC